MFKKIALSIITIILMLSTVAIASERTQIQWNVTITSLPGDVSLTTYYLDYNGIRRLEQTKSWDGTNPVIRTEYLVPGDPAPRYMCAEAELRFTSSGVVYRCYDSEITNDIYPPTFFHLYLGVTEEPEDPGPLPD